MDDDPGGKTAATLYELGQTGEGPAGPVRPGDDARRAGRALFRPETGAWRGTWQWVTGAAVTALLMALTFTGDGWVPLLSGVDLVIHEAGHVVTAWAPPLLCSLAGSVAQIAVPLGLAAYFWIRKDGLAVIVVVAWAAESLDNVSVYVADAQLMLLALVGDDGSGAGHDWHNILVRLDLLESTGLIAGAVRGASVCLFAVAFGLAALGYVRARRA
jgi:hypothetical protein